MDSEKEISLIEKRLEKVEERLLKISEKIFNGFGKGILDLKENFDGMKRLLSKLLVTVFGFGCVGIIISLIFKFLEKK